LTKPFGIGGLRTGYAISSGGVLKKIRKMLVPWSVSSLSQKIIPVIFEHYDEFQATWKLILSEKETLVQEIRNSGIPVEKSRCPFFIARVRKAEEVRSFLLQERGIAVRECTSFGFENKFRIMPSLPENNMKLIYALKSLAVDT